MYLMYGVFISNKQIYIIVICFHDNCLCYYFEPGPKSAVKAKTHIFISYTWSDQKQAKEILERLKVSTSLTDPSVLSVEQCRMHLNK